MPTQTLNLGQYKLSIPEKWKLNGKRDHIEEQLKKIFEESGFFEKITVTPKKGGLSFNRFFTKEGENPYQNIVWEKRDCKITNPDGSIVFEMLDGEVPASFSQVASDVMLSKYFRKAGVPQYDENENQILTESGAPNLGAEKSARQVFNRLAGCWKMWGERYGYFKTKKDADIFEDELKYMLAHQIAAPNSPQWFNTGIAFAYGITGKPQGHYYIDPHTENMMRSEDAYTRPQPHACFIQSIKDDLVNEGGIMNLWTREARIFKYGSGTGTNFSAIRGRGEPLSGGGTSSGLMSFLKIGDSAAGAIKSGGTTRRAAKMVCLDIDHPDIETFISWKSKEEKKVKALVDAGYPSDYEGEAYQTVSGQNSNNSVRISNEFMRALEKQGNWNLKWRTDGRTSKIVPTEELWQKIAESAWASADPGIQYNTTINEWHTCPESGPIRASNPCSEYMFLDDTACNLASINLMKLYDNKTKTFDIEGYKHTIRLWTVVLEISVLMAQFPSKTIARKSYNFRTLGLGYANLGTLLMVSGIPYNSDKARAFAGALSAILTGESYGTSAELARELGAFPKYEKNKQAMLRVMRNHRRAAYGIPTNEDTKKLGNYEQLEIKPVPINPLHCPQNFLEAARDAWDKAIADGEQYGYRNAQTTVIAPTGTIGLLMDCDTTGVEPDFALVKFKKLAGGGYWKIPNLSIEPALRNLGYSEPQIQDILKYIVGFSTLENSSPVNSERLKKNGFTDEDITRVNQELPKVFDLKFAFTKYSLGEKTLQRLGISENVYNSADFNLLDELGFTKKEQQQANKIICGNMTIEGAPHLLDEHLPVFDCANKCGEGKRFIDPMGHINMLAAVQPFISGSISKTINMPGEATVEEIKNVYLAAWQLGLKAVALYRDGSKMSQPLSSKMSEKQENEKPLSDVKTPKKNSVISDTNEQAQLSFIERGTKKELPKRRHGITIEAAVGGHKLFLRTGEYADGTIGEIFIDMHKEGAAFRSLLNCFAIAVSIGLQYGVPLKKLVDKFTFTRFEPNGITDHDNIKTATSIIDFIFRVLGMEYLHRTDFVHVLPESLQTDQDLDSVTAHSEKTATMPEKKTSNEPLVFGASLSEFTSSLMGDAPACSDCGHITIRSGSCYRCLNCGASMGCS